MTARRQAFLSGTMCTEFARHVAVPGSHLYLWRLGPAAEIYDLLTCELQWSLLIWVFAPGHSVMRVVLAVWGQSEVYLGRMNSLQSMKMSTSVRPL